MRLISMFEVTNHVLATVLLISSAGLALYLWSIDQSTAGVVAAVIAMALRLSGHSHWLMWELTNLFENVGTIQDGINTLTQKPTVVDAPDAKPLQIEQGRIEFQDVSFAYRDKSRQVIDKLNLVIKPGERVGLIGRSGAGKSTLLKAMFGLVPVRSGSIELRGTDITRTSGLPTSTTRTSRARCSGVRMSSIQCWPLPQPWAMRASIQVASGGSARSTAAW